jgi:hypothetical protein
VLIWNQAAADCRTADAGNVHMTKRLKTRKPLRRRDQRVQLSLALWLPIVFGTWIASTLPSSATAPFETTGDVRWIIYASRQDLDEAIGLARRFDSQFGQPMVMSTINGRYTVTVGPLSVPDPVAMKKRFSQPETPELWDAFLSKGQAFVKKVWESPKSRVLARASSLENEPHIASAAGLEVRIASENNRMVARINGGQEVATVALGETGDYEFAGASIAKLDASSVFPQVVTTYFTGGFHCCTEMKVLTFTKNRWKVMDIGQFNGKNGPAILDLNGDGSVELVGSDNNFPPYGFGPYAGFYPPPKIFRLVGDQVRDVSAASEFRRPIRQMLLAEEGLTPPERWRDNAFLAGWVGHKALLGEGAEAWRKMLDLYDRNWQESVCRVPTSDTCPSDAKRFRDFPTALRELLSESGYRIEGIVGAPRVWR